MWMQRELVAGGADIDQRDEAGDPPLAQAARKGHSAVVEPLDKGASVDLANDEGWTALMLASWKGYTDVFAVLLENGASVDKQRATGLSALASASEFGHVDAARVLLAGGAKRGLTGREPKCSVDVGGLEWPCERG